MIVLAVLFFAIAWILDVSGKGSGVFFSWTSFVTLGLVAFAAHFLWDFRRFPRG
jgi:hypothetical protein